jgi:ketopantoate hydroxymethyltransferase
MSTSETPAKPVPAKPAGSGPEVGKGEGKREKRTITEIRESKRTGEKMVYMSVPDYTSAQWAEMAGVDVAVLGDSLAMIAHGHRNTVPATMDMMVMHGQAVRRGAPNTFMLGCMSIAHSSMPRASCRNRCATRSSRRAANRKRISCARWWTPAFRPRPISA